MQAINKNLFDDNFEGVRHDKIRIKEEDDRMDLLKDIKKK